MQEEQEYLETLKAKVIAASPFSREELILTRDRALQLGTPIGMPMNPLWVDAYKQLAFACDRLDAMIARTSVGVAQPEDNE